MPELTTIFRSYRQIKMKRSFSLLLTVLLTVPGVHGTTEETPAEPAVVLTKVRAIGAVANPSAIARGAAFLLEGSGFGSEELVEETVSPAPHPQEFAGVSVWLTSADEAASVQVFIRSVAPDRIVAILPSSTAEGEYDVEVHAHGLVSGKSRIEVVERNPGIVTRGLVAGSSAVAWQMTGDELKQNAFTRAARLGQTVYLQVTGLGPIEGPDNGVEPPPAEEEEKEEGEGEGDGGEDATVTEAGDGEDAGEGGGEGEGEDGGEGEGEDGGEGEGEDGEEGETAPEGPPSLIDLETAVILVGGQEVPLTFAGRDENRPGYDVLVFTLPESDINVNCVVPVSLRIGEEFVSLGATLSVVEAAPPAEEDEGEGEGEEEAGATVTEEGQDGEEGGEGEGEDDGEEGEPEPAEEILACLHPLKLTPESLKALDEGGEVVIGVFNLTKQSANSVAMGQSVNVDVSVASGHFGAYDALALAADMARPDNPWVLNFDGCTVYTQLDDPLNPKMVDAGAFLSLRGPNGIDVKLEKHEESGAYLHTFAAAVGGLPGLPSLPGIPGLPGLPGLPTGPSGIQPGDYTLTGTGGEVIGEFTTDLKVSPAVTWTNRDAITQINRSADLTFTWTPGPADDFVSATGVSRGVDPDEGSEGKIVSRAFVCLTPADRGTVTVPAAILSRMPVSNADPVINETYGNVGLTHTGGVANGLFSAPLVQGGGTARSQVSFSLGATKSINYR